MADRLDLPSHHLEQAEQATPGYWRKVLLGEVATVRSGFAFKSSDWSSEGIPVVKIANVKGGNLVMESCSFVSQETAARSEDFSLHDGDILIAMTGYIGDVSMVRSSSLPAVLNQRVGRFNVRDPNRLLEKFLFYVLRSEDVRGEIEALGYGSAQPNVSPTLIQSVDIPLPPLPEQRAIAQYLDHVDRRIRQYVSAKQKLIALLEEEKQAVINQAVTRGLDPNVRLKPSGVEWLGDVPEHWEVVRLSSLGTTEQYHQSTE